jgi:hypothetical protein
MLFLSSFPMPVRLLGAFCLGVLAWGGAQAPAAHAQKDYEEWRKEQRQKYQQYLDRQDKAFLKFLKRQWTSVEVEAQTGSPIDDKPAEIPTAGGEGGEQAPADAAAQLGDDPAAPSRQSEPDQPGDRTEATRESPAPREPSPQPQAPSPDRAPQGAAEGTASTAALTFFGVQTTVPYSPSLAPAVEGAPGKETIRSYWRTMAKQDYKPTLEAVQARRDDLGLGDWGYYVYLRDLGTRLYEEKGAAGSGSNAATLWTWFMMMKSGYAVRVGYRGDNVFLLLPVDEQIYDRPQMYINDQRYYLMVEEGGGGSLRTYEGQHEEADQVLSIDEQVLPSLSGATKQRSASFSYDGERYNIEFAYDTAVLDYLRAYPNVELSVLFRSGVSSTAESSLRDALGPHLEGRSAREALTFLLRFVQFATTYKRDRENFGEERYLFPEESLAVSASDCEDRAVLFAYLARTLLDRRVVGLEWPSHIATAVRVGGGLEATSEDRALTVDGATYIMADPTYIGSSLGMEMPFVEGKAPDVITFNSN